VLKYITALVKKKIAGHNMDNIDKNIKEIMARSFMIEETALKDNARLVEDLGVDSLGVFELVVNIEDEFGVKIEDKEMLKFSTVKDTVEGLKKVINQGLLS
jgi:acyl carrier protein